MEIILSDRLSRYGKFSKNSKYYEINFKLFLYQSKDILSIINNSYVTEYSQNRYEREYSGNNINPYEECLLLKNFAREIPFQEVSSNLTAQDCYNIASKLKDIDDSFDLIINKIGLKIVAAISEKLKTEIEISYDELFTLKKYSSIELIYLDYKIINEITKKRFLF